MSKAFKNIRILLPGISGPGLFREYFLVLAVAVSFLMTFLTLPRIDYIDADPLFYFKQLPFPYYLSVITCVVATILGRSRFTRVFSIVTFALLIEFTPSIMFVNPWHSDSYGFLAQAVHIARDGHITHLKDLQESPSLALTFGAQQLLTGVDPLLLFKIYQLLVVSIFVLLLYSIAENIVGSGGNAAIASLAFFAILWPITFHFNRQNFSIVFYLAAWHLLSKALFVKRDNKTYYLTGFMIFLMVLSHPATPLYFVSNLVAVIVLAGLFKRLSHRELKDLLYLILFTLLIWLGWHYYMVPEAAGLNTIYDLIINFYESLRYGLTEISGSSEIFGGYTSVYSVFVSLRLALSFLPVVIIFPLLFLVYRFRDNVELSKLSIILMAWLLSNLSSALPLLYAGLPFFYRPVLFAGIAWGPIVALIYGLLINVKGLRTKRILPSRNMSKTLRLPLLICFIIIPCLILPVIKYSALPYLYPTTKELSAKMFLDTHQGRALSAIYLEDNRPWLYTYILMGVDESGVIMLSSIGENIIGTLRSETLFVTDRLVTRDVFIHYDPTMYQIIANVSEFTETTHNKVYDAGGYNWILHPEAILESIDSE